MVPAFLLLVSIIGLFHTHQVQGDRECSTSFHSLHDIYRACAPGITSQEPRYVPLRYLRHVTGSDVIVELQRMCRSIPRLYRCSATSLEGCPAHLTQTFQSAVDASMWFCDADNNIKGSITRALTGAVSPPEDQRVKSHCVGGEELHLCPTTLLGMDRFRVIRDYGSIIEQDAREVLANPVPKDYFRELMSCYGSKVQARCPLNVLPMVLSDQYHLIAPPKFGINISALILDEAADLQTLETVG